MIQKLLLLLFIPILLSAEPVAYSGIFTSGDIAKFPFYNKDSEQINSAVIATLKELQAENRLQFDLQFETNVEMDKWDINDPFSLGILVTRDDIAEEEFTSKLSDGRIIQNYKNTAKVGMVLFAYQTIGRQKKRNIVYTAQYIHYDTLISPNKPLSETERQQFCTKTFLDLIKTKIASGVTKFGIGTIIGETTSFRKAGDIAEISVGSNDGVEIGQRVQFGESVDEFSPYGTVESLEKRSAKVKVTYFDAPPAEGSKVSIKNLRGLSSDIFQVTSFGISSAKAEAFYKEQNYDISEDIAQAFTDYLATEAGKVVLPARTGSWITGSVEQAEAILVRDGESFSFAMPKPTYPISLTLSGLGHKISEENAVAVITGFKGWLLCEIPVLNYSKESTFSMVKRSVQGVQEYSVFDVYYDLLLNLTSKSVGELEL